MSEEDPADDPRDAPAAASGSLPLSPIVTLDVIDVVDVGERQELHSPAIDGVMGGGPAAAVRPPQSPLSRLHEPGGIATLPPPASDIARLVPVPAKSVLDGDKAYTTTLIGFSLGASQLPAQPAPPQLARKSDVELAALPERVHASRPAASSVEPRGGLGGAIDGRPSQADQHRADGAIAADAPSEAEAHADTALYRQEALDAHYGDTAERNAIDDPSGTAWIGLVVLASLVVTALGVALFAEIEITAKAPGAVRAPAGLRPVASVIAGAVSEILVRPGQTVEPDQVLARLEGKPLRVALDTSTHALELLQRQSEHAAREDAQLLARSSEAFRRRRTSLSERQRILSAQHRQRAARLKDFEELLRHGAASGEDALTARESVEQVATARATLQAEIALLDLEATDRQRAFHDRQEARAAKLDQANESVREARELLEQIEVRSPSAGRIESLLVGANDIIAAGQVLAQVVPHAAPQTIVAFLPARDTAFVRVGALSNVEVESLPVSEFGRASARVERISTDVAQPREVEAALGEAAREPLVRVELVLEEDLAYQSMREHLRSGDRVLVRLHRRQRRIIALLFDFARKWVE